MIRQALPIDGALPELAGFLREHSAVVLQAPAGAGKTTRVPPGILQAGLAGNRRIAVLQPRRLAARSTAARMAAENGWQLGQEVGYQVRFEKRTSRATRIAVVTEGILLRQLRHNPFLEDVAVVVFDEFHERNLDSELALGMVRQVQQTVRPDVKIVIMSATLDAATIARYLDDCPVVRCEGRTYPVEIRYQNPAQRAPVAESVADGVRQVLSHTAGHLLVFLPGLREIRRARSLIEDELRGQGLDVCELYGDLPAERQDAVLAPGERRKVILSTNLAETSVTIEGVTAVVDSGWQRQLRFDPRVGLDRLELTPISRASAEQRAGRAGRTQPGLCLRLWDERSHGSRPAFEEPEIRRVDLAAAVLQLLCWIEPDWKRYPWFETPRDESLAQALRLLRRLDAVRDSEITPLGRRLAELPLHPRLGRLLLEAKGRGCEQDAALAAALLSERDPFAGPRRERSGSGPRHVSQSDVVDRVRSLQELEGGRGGESSGEPVSRQAARQVFRVRNQLLRVLGESGNDAETGGAGRRPNLRGTLGEAGAEAGTGGSGRRPNLRGVLDEEVLASCLLAAFPDRLARRREPGSRRAVMVGGRGVRLADESAVSEGELFLCVDVDGAGAEALVRQASAISRAVLPAEHLTEQLDVFFDEATERLAARRRRYWEDLLLDESPAGLPNAGQATQVLAAAASRRLDRVFPADDSAVAGFVARVRCLAQWCPELGLPTWDDASLSQLLPVLCVGRKSFAELRAGPWLGSLRGQLSREQLRAVEQLAPERVLVPSGRSVMLQYEPGKPPILAVRIQELFGWAESPRIARGRVSVLLHLLAPNQRVEQVTEDLRSFWDRVYPRVRKDLRGRYPKHAWPEDPWHAKPEHK